MRSTNLKKVSSILVICLMVLSASNVWAFAQKDKITTAKALAHYAMGNIYDLLGLTYRAVLEYEKASQFDEGAYLIHLRLGADYARMDMLDEAVEQLKIVDKQNPDDLQSHYLLALIYSTQKEYGLAAMEYEYILKSFSQAEPQNIEIYGYLGQLYYSQKKYQQAIDQFEQILSLEPENADVLYLLGSLYIEIENYDRAIDLLNKSIEIDPEHDGSLNALGYIYADRNMKLNEAQKLVERALTLDPDNGAYLDSLGWVFYQKGQYREALTYFERADNFLKDPVIYEHLGDTYLKLNKLEEAKASWNKSLELLPGQESVLQKLEDLKNIKASR